MFERAETIGRARLRPVVLVLMGMLLSACSPDIGSEAWCDDMEDKPKGDWSANEATDYAQNCVFRKDDD